MNGVSIVLADDVRLFRECFRGVLEGQEGLRLVAEAEDAEQARSAVLRNDPDLVVMGLSLGFSLLSELSAAGSRRVLALDTARDDLRAARALERGATAYATKEQPLRDVLEALHCVARGQRYVAPVFDHLASPRTRAAAASLAVLTSREREIFDLTVGGANTSDVASRLQISRRTVETHRSRILHKLGANSAGDLIRLAARLGILR